MSTTGICPTCGEQCVIRYRDCAAAEYLCSCRHPTTESARADEAIAQAGEHAPSEWMAEAIGAVRALAGSQSKFTADDIWRMVGAPPEPRALGAIMRQAKRDKLCEPTDAFVTSERRHGAPIRVWQSMLFGGRAVEDCLLCGESLEGKRPEAKFCCDLHKAEWHRRQHETEGLAA